MQNDNIIFLCKRNQFFIKSIIRHRTNRVGRIGHDHELRRPRGLLRNVLELRQEIIFCIERVGFNLRTRQLRSQGKDRITWIRGQHNIARITERDSHMGHALLGAVQGHNLVRLQTHPETLLIEILHGPDKLRPIRNGVLVILRILTGLHHSVHHMLRRLEIRRSDGKVIDLHAFLHQLVLFMGQGREDALLNGFGPF